MSISFFFFVLQICLDKYHQMFIFRFKKDWAYIALITTQRTLPLVNFTITEYSEPNDMLKDGSVQMSKVSFGFLISFIVVFIIAIIVLVVFIFLRKKEEENTNPSASVLI